MITLLFLLSRVCRSLNGKVYCGVVLDSQNINF